MKVKTLLFIAFLLINAQLTTGQELYQMPENKTTRWVSFENIRGEKGQGGQENKGAKGHAFDIIPAGSSIDLVDMKGSGTIRRIWLTLSNRSPEMLRTLRVDMYWDGHKKPAVSVPVGDFFGIGLGKKVPFESALFSDPEGRSFNCFIPMPFKESARITITNESEDESCIIFYDVNILMETHDEDMLYFHAYWSRSVSTKLGEDFVLLPEISGHGRFLGTNIGVQTNRDYEDTWWGEGEVKVYLDGDRELPTLVGSGTEDYVGTAYGQGTYAHQYQGSLIADPEKGLFAFYRYHIPDPVYFNEDIRVAIQQIGGAPYEKVLELMEKGADLQPISIHSGETFIKLLEREQPADLQNTTLPKGWVNFYRSDDVSATAYFYLNQPTTTLPVLPEKSVRVEGLRK